MATKKKAKKSKGLSIAIIILAILLIFIVILIKKDTIITNLKETNFFGRVFGTTPEFVEKHPVEESKTEDIKTESTVTLKVQTESANENKKDSEKTPSQEEASKKSSDSSEEKVTEIKKEEAEKAETKQKSAKEEASSSKKQVTELAYTELQLCFVEIDADGSVIRKNIKRSIPKNDSPLTTALKLLLEGPDTTKSAEKNCMTLIPSGTRLLAARVQDGIAYLDFSENFEFNSYGVEGYNGQLMQVVYTATNFSTVKSVQFLIEGKKKEYLGSEGQWIGSPLSRSSF